MYTRISPAGLVLPLLLILLLASCQFPLGPQAKRSVSLTVSSQVWLPASGPERFLTPDAQSVTITARQGDSSGTVLLQTTVALQTVLSDGVITTSATATLKGLPGVGTLWIGAEVSLKGAVVGAGSTSVVVNGSNTPTASLVVLPLANHPNLVDLVSGQTATVLAHEAKIFRYVSGASMGADIRWDADIADLYVQARTNTGAMLNPTFTSKPGFYSGVYLEYPGTSAPSYLLLYNAGAADVTLTLDYLPNRTVKFNSMGGSGVPPLTNVRNGTPFAGPPNPIRVGYTFLGWYRESACVSLWNFSKDGVSDDATLYAGWQVQATSGHSLIKLFDPISQSWTTPVPFSYWNPSDTLLFTDGWTWYGVDQNSGNATEGWFGTGWDTTDSSTYAGYNQVYQNASWSAITEVTTSGIFLYGALADGTLQKLSAGAWTSTSFPAPSAIATGAHLASSTPDGSFLSWQTGSGFFTWNGSSWVYGGGVPGGTVDMVMTSTDFFAITSSGILRWDGFSWKPADGYGPSNVPGNARWIRYDSMSVEWWAFLTTGQVLSWNAATQSWEAVVSGASVPTTDIGSMRLTGGVTSVTTSRGDLYELDRFTGTYSLVLAGPSDPPGGTALWRAHQNSPLAVAFNNLLYSWDGASWQSKTRAWVSGQLQVSPPIGTYQLTTSVATGGGSDWSWYAAVANGDTELWELRYDGNWYQVTGPLSSGYGYVHPIPAGKTVKFMSSSYGTSLGAMQLIWDDTLFVTRSDAPSGWQSPATSGAKRVPFSGLLPAGSSAVGEDLWENIIVAVPMP